MDGGKVNGTDNTCAFAWEFNSFMNTRNWSTSPGALKLLEHALDSI